MQKLKQASASPNLPPVCMDPGKLRRAVQEFLEGHPLVSAFRPGGPREGGGGATIVELKD